MDQMLPVKSNANSGPPVHKQSITMVDTKARPGPNGIRQAFKRSAQKKQLKRVLISDAQKLMLEAVIDLGIYGTHASSILGFTSSSRLMKRLGMQRQKEQVDLMGLSRDQRFQEEQRTEMEKRKAQFDAVLAVSRAIENHTIQDQHCQRMHERIDKDCALAVQEFDIVHGAS